MSGDNSSGVPFFFLRRIKQARASDLIISLAEHYSGTIVYDKAFINMYVDHANVGMNPISLMRLGAKRRVSWIWSYNLPNLWKAYWTSKTAKVPIVYNFMGVDIEVNKKLGYGFRRSWLREKVFRLLMRIPDYYVCMSPYIKQLALDAGIPENKLVEIPNFFDLKDQFNKSTRKERDKVKEYLGLENPIIICVARHDAKKGVELLIEAFSKTRTDANLLMIGKGPLMEQHKKRASELGVSDRTMFIERVPRDQLRTYYAIADVSCNLSYTDAFCNPVVEAISQGTPVIVSEGVGAGWYLKDEPYCQQTTSRDPEEIAGLIDRSISENQKKQYSKIMVKDSKRFEQDKVLKEWIAFLDGVS